jgi:hypothetical protein
MAGSGAGAMSWPGPCNSGGQRFAWRFLQLKQDTIVAFLTLYAVKLDFFRQLHI